MSAVSLAAFAEHLFTRLLLGMTLTIQVFVYPDAYPVHGIWAAVLLMLMAQGPGRVSLDHWLARRYQTPL